METYAALSVAFIGMPQGFEWIVIALALLLIFGRRLPEVMRGLGGSVREFKKGMDDGPKTEAPPAPRVEGAVSRDASRDAIAPVAPMAPTTPAPPAAPTDPKPH